MTFAFGTFWFWLAVLVFSGIIIWGIEADSGTLSTAGLIFGVAFVAFLTDSHIFQWSLNNLGKFAMMETMLAEMVVLKVVWKLNSLIHVHK